MNILVVGVNGFGQMHLSAINNMDISIVERNENVIRQVKDKYSIKKVYSDYNEALKDDFDIVDLVVPHYLHREMAIKAMKLKKNVIIEKPIATSVNDGLEMIRASRENGVKFMVLDQYFFDPSVQASLKLINNKKIGRVHSIIVRDQRFYNKPGWRTDKNLMGGGSLIDGGIHFINTMLTFGGDYDKIYADNFHGGSSINGEDTTLALFKFKSGSAGFLFYTWAYANSPKVPAFEIIGDEGSIYEDPNSRTSWDKDNKIRTVYGDIIMNGQKINVEKYDVYTREIEAFMESVVEDCSVPFDPVLELRDLRAVMDIYHITK